MEMSEKEWPNDWIDDEKDETKRGSRYEREKKQKNKKYWKWANVQCSEEMNMKLGQGSYIQYPNIKHQHHMPKYTKAKEKRISEWNDDRANFSLFKFSSYFLFIFSICFPHCCCCTSYFELNLGRKNVWRKTWNEWRQPRSTVLTVANTRIHYKILFYVNKTQDVKDNQGLAWVLCVCAARKRSESQKRNEMFYFSFLLLPFSHSVWYAACFQTTTAGFVCFWFSFFFLLLLLSFISFFRLLVNFPFFLLLFITISDEQSRTVTVYSVYQEHCYCEFPFGIFYFSSAWKRE